MQTNHLRTLITNLIIAISFSSSAQSLPDSIPLRVIIIRHGEKPDSGLNLSCKGYNRSLALPNTIVSQFGLPAYVYVPIIRIGKSTNSVRMYQTIVPFVVRYALVVNSRHAETDSTGIAADILNKRGTVLIVWDSKNIPPIARNLGVKKKILKWIPDDFDTIWVINYRKTKKGKLVAELSIAAEGLDPSSECH